jgi:hypothetical protein
MIALVNVAFYFQRKYFPNATSAEMEPVCASASK